MTNLFNKKGMMAYPNEIKKKYPCHDEKLVVVEGCFCQNGHNLVDRQSDFHGFPGIVLKIKNGKEWGTAALSPIKNDSSRIVFGTKVNKGDIAEFYCPQCGIQLPIYTDCSCGAHVFCLFLDDVKDFTECIGICSRVGCFNARIIDDMSHIGQRRSKIQQGR